MALCCSSHGTRGAGASGLGRLIGAVENFSHVVVVWCVVPGSASGWRGWGGVVCVWEDEFRSSVWRVGGIIFREIMPARRYAWWWVAVCWLNRRDKGRMGVTRV